MTPAACQHQLSSRLRKSTGAQCLAQNQDLLDIQKKGSVTHDYEEKVNGNK